MNNIRYITNFIRKLYIRLSADVLPRQRIYRVNIGMFARYWAVSLDNLSSDAAETVDNDVSPATIPLSGEWVSRRIIAGVPILLCQACRLGPMRVCEGERTSCRSLIQ